MWLVSTALICADLTDVCPENALCLDDPQLGMICECSAGYQGNASVECLSKWWQLCGFGNTSLLSFYYLIDKILFEILLSCRHNLKYLKWWLFDNHYKLLTNPSLDINECLDPDTCHINTNCMDTEGSFTCECRNGFEVNGQECEGKGFTCSMFSLFNFIRQQMELSQRDTSVLAVIYTPSICRIEYHLS